jgi:hypothetical protein
MEGSIDRQIKHAASLEERLGHLAQQCGERAKTLPPGSEREEMMRKTQQADTAAHLSRLVASPGLQPPE